MQNNTFTLSNGQRIVYEPPSENSPAHDPLGSLHRSPTYYNPTAHEDHLVEGLGVPSVDVYRFKMWLDCAPWRGHG